MHRAATVLCPLYTSSTLCNNTSILFLQVIGHRQAGKSTIVVLLDHYISQKQVNVGNTVLESIGICLNKNTPMVCLWNYMVGTLLRILYM